jgi:hypothetical protein
VSRINKIQELCKANNIKFEEWVYDERQQDSTNKGTRVLYYARLITKDDMRHECVFELTPVSDNWPIFKEYEQQIEKLYSRIEEKLNELIGAKNKERI